LTTVDAAYTLDLVAVRMAALSCLVLADFEGSLNRKSHTEDQEKYYQLLSPDDHGEPSQVLPLKHRIRLRMRGTLSGNNCVRLLF